MKGQRDMFYGNIQAGGFQEPNMIITPPSGYNINTQYSAYGPNAMMGNTPMMGMNQGINEYDERLTKVERQIRNLDERIRKLETDAGTSNSTDSNLYML